MDALSPLAQRIVAVALLVLAILVTISAIIVPLVEAAGDSITTLAVARERVARLEAVANRVPGPARRHTPSGTYIEAASAQLATDRFRANLQDIATRAGLTGISLSAAPSLSSGGAGLSLQIVADGSDEAVLHFINEVERGAPVVRFRQWRLSAVEGQAHRLHLEGLAQAAWARSR